MEKMIEKTLPQYVVKPLGVAFIVTAFALVYLGSIMIVGKGSVSFPLKKGK